MAQVSVVVPVYNVEPYLRTCMESITRQTLRDLEIICVNDGSKDGSLAILKEFAEKDPRIVLIDQPNGGYGKAMNAGIDRATGEYLGIVEPDDFIALTMYEDLYQIAKENDLDLVKADFYRFFTESEYEMETFIRSHLSKNPEDYGSVFCPMERTSSFFYIMNTWSGIYRMSFLREHGIRHQETPGAAFQDNGFWFQTFIYAKRMMIVDKPYYRVRRDNPNSSIRNPSKVYAMNIEYDHIRGILMRDPEVWQKLKGVYWRKRYHNYDGTLKRIDPSFVPEYRKQISKELQWGKKRGEWTEADFPEYELETLRAFLENRETPIVRESQLPPGEAQARAELALVMNSGSFKAGRALTWLPRKLRDLIRGKEGEQA